MSLMNGEHAYQFIIGNTKIPLFYMPYENPNTMELNNKKEFNRTQTIGGQAFEHWGEQPTIMSISMRIRKNSYSGNMIGLYKEQKYDLEDPMVCTELEMMKLIYHMDRRKLKYKVNKTSSGVSNLISKGSEIKKSKSLLSVATGSIGTISSSSPNSAIMNTLTINDNSGISSGKASQNTGAVVDTLNKFSDTVIIYKTGIYSGFFTDFKIIDNAETPFFHTVKFNFQITSSLVDDFIYDSIADTVIGKTIGTLVGIASTVSALGYIADSATEGVKSIGEGFF